MLGVLASLLLIVGVLPGGGSGRADEVSYLALPPLLSALWFEVWENRGATVSGSFMPPSPRGLRTRARQRP